MKYMTSVIIVKNMEKSRDFYERFLDQEVEENLGAHVSYKGFILQTLEFRKNFINNNTYVIDLNKNNENELYFEVEDFSNFVVRLKLEENIELVHDIKTYPWGQRAIRFYDPDNHIIEVGETLENVVKRQLNEGMSVKEIVEKTDLPKQYIMQIKEKNYN